eukprot:356402-Chlamydomonas_euryale.AAC.1
MSAPPPRLHEEASVAHLPDAHVRTASVELHAECFRARAHHADVVLAASNDECFGEVRHAACVASGAGSWRGQRWQMKVWPVAPAALADEGVALAGGGVALAGEGVALAGKGVALAGGGVALAGEGVALAGGGVALAGGGVALAGEGVALADEGVALAGVSAKSHEDRSECGRQRVCVHLYVCDL